jgi:hypothetical protein
LPGGSAATKETQKVFTTKSAKHTKVSEINKTELRNLRVLRGEVGFLHQVCN